MPVSATTDDPNTITTSMPSSPRKRRSMLSLARMAEVARPASAPDLASAKNNTTPDSASGSSLGTHSLSKSEIKEKRHYKRPSTPTLLMLATLARTTAHIMRPKDPLYEKPEIVHVDVRLDKEIMSLDPRSHFGFRPREGIVKTKLAVFKPTTFDVSRSTKYPLHIHMHGGGFIFGHAEMTTGVLRRLSNDADCVIVSINYLLAPEHPWPHAPEQCFAVFKYLVDELPGGGATRWNLDVTRLSFGGWSAGANLASALAFMTVDRRGYYNPRAQARLLVSVYPPVDLNSNYLALMNSFHRKSPTFTKSIPPSVATFMETCYIPFHPSNTLDYKEQCKHPYLSPIHGSDAQLQAIPRALVLTGAWDSLHVHGDQFAQRLRSLGVRVTHRCYENAKHAWVEMQPGQKDYNHEAKEDTIRLIVGLMRETFHGESFGDDDGSLENVESSVDGETVTPESEAAGLEGAEFARVQLPSVTELQNVLGADGTAPVEENTAEVIERVQSD